MAGSDNQTKVLRVGVIQGGKVIEERLIRKRDTVTVGSDAKNTFVFQGDDLPKSWSLFEAKGGQYTLVFGEDMNGRVSVESNNVDFASLKAQNLAEKQGDRYRLELNDSSRGRVQLSGELTLLFHFVNPPPVATKPELPSSVKGGWLKSIEPVFTSVLMASFALHMVSALLVMNVDPPPPVSKADLEKWIKRVAAPKAVEIKQPETPDPTPSKGDKGKSSGKTQEKPKPEEKPAEKPAGGKKPGRSAGAAAKAEAGQRANVREKLANSGAGLLGLIGEGGGDGAVADVFGSGTAVTSDLGSAIGAGGGVGVAGAGTDLGRAGVGGTGGAGTGGGKAANIGKVGTGGGGKVATAGKVRAKVSGSVRAADVEPLDGEIDQKGVKRALSRRKAAFKQCYESALKSNSKLKGKLVIEFTINGRGRVTKARVVKDTVGSSEVAKCVVKAMKRVKFPKPEDGDVTISNSFVFQPS